jgi:hypothetical protein
VADPTSIPVTSSIVVAEAFVRWIILAPKREITLPALREAIVARRRARRFFMDQEFRTFGVRIAAAMG